MKLCGSCKQDLKPTQKAYCSTPCRVQGMRAAKLMQQPHQADTEPDSEPAKYVDWRRPQADADAAASWTQRRRV